MTDDSGQYTDGTERFSDPLVTYEMRFDDKHIDGVLEGEKTLTARLDLEWRHVYDHDGLKIQNERGEWVAEAIVKRARTLRLDRAFPVVEAHSGHGNYGTVHQFRAAMNEYYQEEIYKNTDLRLIHFEVVRHV